MLLCTQWMNDISASHTKRIFVVSLMSKCASLISCLTYLAMLIHRCISLNLYWNFPGDPLNSLFFLDAESASQTSVIRSSRVKILKLGVAWRLKINPLSFIKRFPPFHQTSVSYIKMYYVSIVSRSEKGKCARKSSAESLWLSCLLRLTVIRWR